MIKPYEIYRKIGLLVPELGQKGDKEIPESLRKVIRALVIGVCDEINKKVVFKPVQEDK